MPTLGCRRRSPLPGLVTLLDAQRSVRVALPGQTNRRLEPTRGARSGVPRGARALKRRTDLRHGRLLEGEALLSLCPCSSRRSG